MSTPSFRRRPLPRPGSGCCYYLLFWGLIASLEFQRSSAFLPPTTLQARRWRGPTLYFSNPRRSDQSGNNRGRKSWGQNDRPKRYDKNRKHSNGGNFPFNQELKRLTRKRHPNAAAWAHERLEEALLEEENAVSEAHNNTGKQQVDEVSFNTVITGYAKQSERGDSQAPFQAEALLRKMEELGKTRFSLKPSVFTYNGVMEAWSKSSLPRGKSSVLRIFNELKQHPTLTPNTYSYNLVLAAYAYDSSRSTTKDVQNSLKQMEQFYEEMQNSVSDESSNIEPDRRTISVLLAAYARHGQAQKAQQILDSVWRRYRNGQLDLKPNQVWINCVINAWAKSKLPQAGKRADEILGEMQALYELGQSSIRPDTTSYNSCMNCHAESGNSTRVEELLDELEHRYALTGEADLEPDTISYSTAIKAYANNKDQSMESKIDAANQAIAILHRMEQLFAAGRTNVAPNLVTYNTVVKIWAQLATREGLDQATGLLKRLKRHNSLKPDATTYVELILGWSRSGLRDAGYKAEKLLYEMERLPQSRQYGLDLTVAYNAVINAWAKSLDYRVAPRRVEALLDLLTQKFFEGGSACPDTITFLLVSDAYAKSRVPDAQKKCNVLVKRMDQLVEAGAANIYRDRRFWNSILNAFGKSEQRGVSQKAEEIVAQMEASDDENCRPDIVTYSALISCHTKSGEPPDRAEELLDFVEESYDNGNELLRPNAVFYSAVQQAWSKNSATSEGADKAERLLRRNERLWKEGKEHCKPHAIVYNAVMDAIARTARHGDICCGRRAEALLLEMEDMYKAGYPEMKPSRRSFSAVMLAYRQDGDADKAEELLERMESLARDSVYDVNPTVVDYNCAIGALADSKDPNAADRSQALLDRMIELYRNGDLTKRPDEKTYSGVIKAWLKRNDEKGSAMANAILRDFLAFVEEIKATDGQSLSTEAVFNVLHAYGDGGSEEEVEEDPSVDDLLESMSSAYDEIDWSAV